jgi:hypothetical protein
VVVDVVVVEVEDWEELVVRVVVDEIVVEVEAVLVLEVVEVVDMVEDETIEVVDVVVVPQFSTEVIAALPLMLIDLRGFVLPVSCQ